MKLFKRSIYLFYYLSQLKKKQFQKFVIYAASTMGVTKLRITVDAILSVYKYNVSIVDYFYFRFFEQDKEERESWAGTGFMYEYQLKMNPKNSREVLIDKIKFLQHFQDFILRNHLTIEELRRDPDSANKLLVNPSLRLVLKGSRGQVGAQVEVVESQQFSTESLIVYMKANGYDLVEQYIVQHDALMKLSPSGVNTVRIFTQFENGVVRILGARLRVSVNSKVDNMAAGNIAAPIQLDSGIVNGPGVYSDITKEDVRFHPITNEAIEDFIIPYWNEVLQLADDAARHSPENRSVGWDIAITPDGPDLIEGNHNWCKILWQLPVKKGLKKELEKF